MAPVRISLTHAEWARFCHCAQRNCQRPAHVLRDLALAWLELNESPPNTATSNT